jgi:Sec-independent protein translocase protein TatA
MTGTVVVVVVVVVVVGAEVLVELAALLALFVGDCRDSRLVVPSPQAATARAMQQSKPMSREVRSRTCRGLTFTGQLPRAW